MRNKTSSLPGSARDPRECDGPGATATAFPAGSGGVPAGMANDVTGKMFYVASGGDNTVTTEIIGSGCALTESPGGPVGTGVTRAFLESLTAFP
jgi:hypothetical protein